MRKVLLLLTTLLLWIAGSVPALADAEDLSGKKIASVGDAVTSIDDFDGNTWYILETGGTGRTGYAYVLGSSYYNGGTGDVTLVGGDAAAAMLFRVVPNGDDTYSLIDGLGNYLALNEDWDTAYTEEEGGSYTTFGIANPDADTDASVWYIYESTGGTILDTNGPGSTVAGWGDVDDGDAPTSTTGNNAMQFFPVTLEEDDTPQLSSGSYVSLGDLATELVEGTWYYINNCPYGSRTGWIYSSSHSYYNASSAPDDGTAVDDATAYLFRIASDEDGNSVLINGDGYAMSTYPDGSYNYIYEGIVGGTWTISHIDENSDAAAFSLLATGTSYYLDTNGAGSSPALWPGTPTVDGNECLYFYEVEFINYADSLQALLDSISAACLSITFTTGTNPGYYDADAYAAYLTAYEEATDAVDGDVDADTYAELAAELRTTFAAAATRNPVEEGYYNIVSWTNYYKLDESGDTVYSNAKGVMFSTDGSALQWDLMEENAAKYIFYITPLDDGYFTVYHPLTDTYISACDGSNGAVASMSSEAGEQIISYVNYSNVTLDPGKYWFSTVNAASTGKAYQPLYHNEGAYKSDDSLYGTGPANIIIWGAANNSNNNWNIWKFEAVDESEVKELLAEAEEESSTMLSTEDEIIVVTISCNRGTLTVYDTYSTYTVPTVQGSTNTSGTASTDDEAQYFVLYPVGDGTYYLYSVSEGKIVNGVAGQLTDGTDDTTLPLTFTVTADATDGYYAIYESSTGYRWNITGDGVTTIDSWTSSDDGNMFVFTTIDYTGDTSTIGETIATIVATIEANIAADETVYITDLDSLTNGTIIYVESARGFAYYDGDDVLGSLTTNPADSTSQFVLYTTDEIDGYYLYSVAAEAFVGVDEISTTPTVFTLVATGDETYPWILSTEVDGTTYYANNNNSGSVVINTWTSVDGGNKHRFVVAEVSETIEATIEEILANAVDLSALEEALEALEEAIETYPLGDGLGYYSIPGYTTEEVEESIALAEAYLALTSGQTQELVDSIAELITAGTAALTINLPEAGTFLRIQSVNTEYYLSSDASENDADLAAFVEDGTAAENIFYYDGTSLISYANGYYPTANAASSGVLGLAFNEYTEEGTDISFAQFVGNASTGTISGAYAVYYASSAYMLSADDSNYATALSTRNGGKWLAFYLEEVEALPVEVSESGVTTLATPVALEVADGVTAYSVTLNEDITLSKTALDGTIIPAGSVVLLEAEEGTYELTITTSDDEAVTASLSGQAATQTAQESAYVLSEDGTCFAATSDELAGFAAYLISTSGVEAIYFATEEEGDDDDDTEEVAYKIASIGDAVTSTDAFDGETYYLFKIGGTGRTGYAYNYDGYYYNGGDGDVTAVGADAAATMLFKVVPNDDGTYSLVDGTGAYMALSGWTQPYAAAEGDDYTTFNIGNPDADTDASVWYLQEATTSIILDTNDPGTTMAGWGTDAPTETTGNNAMQFIPVTLEADETLTVPEGDWIEVGDATEEIAEEQWYYLYQGPYCDGYTNYLSIYPDESYARSYYYSAESAPEAGSLSEDAADYLFRFSANEDGTFSIVSATGLAMSAFIGSWGYYLYQDPVASAWNIEQVDVESDATIFSAEVAATEGYYIDTYGTGWYACLWNDTPSVSSCNVFQFIPVTFTEADYSDLETALAAVEAITGGVTIGSDLCEYALEGYDGDVDEAGEAIAEATEIVNGGSASASDVEALVELLTAIAESATGVSLNMPEDGTFLRIKSSANWLSTQPYLSSGNSEYASANASTERAEFVTDGTGAGTIFYYVDGTLVNYETGYYLTSLGNGFAAYDGVTTATSVSFAECYNGETSAYNVVFAGSRYLYTQYKTSDDELVYYTDAGNTPSAYGYNFELEYVETLPVTTNSLGYATLYTPVAVTLADGATVYEVTLGEDDVLATTAVEADTIGAGSAVLIAGDASTTYSFTIVEAESEAVTGDLTGDVATVESADDAYTLSTESADDVYTDADGVILFVLNEGEIQGFTAYLSATDSDEDITGIDGATVAADGEDAQIYDLQGRAVSKTVKGGIYIINGKKVYVK